MNFKILFFATLLMAFQSNLLKAQTKEELQQLMNSESNPKKNKEKPKKEPKQETAKPEKKKEETKQETKAESVKTETKKAEPKPQTETKSNGGEKLKELPDPQTIGFRKNKKFGKKLFQRGSIYNGLKYYEAAITKKPKKTFINQPLADGNYMIRDYKTANRYYKTLVELDSVKHKNLFALYQYALTDKFLGNYEQAKKTFNRFTKLAKDNPTFTDLRKNANLEVQGCDFGIAQRDSKDLRTYKISHLGENINQPFTDYAPFLKDANTLYYGAWVSERVMLENKKEKYADFSRIYSSTRSGKNWNKSEPVKGEVNEVKAHTGNATFSKDGNTMYYTQCLQLDNQQMRCDIYKSTFGNTGWSAGDKLSAVNADGFTSTHPAVGKNEAGDEVLYFASDRNVGKGMDLFYSKINSDGSVGKPKSVGPSVNTRGDEMTPFYNLKTNTLYFSSNGRVSMGGADVFKTSLKNGEWAEPENLGTPVNSSVDDMYFMWNDYSALGFVVSNRPGGFGVKSETCCDDIYQLELNKLYLAVKGTIQNTDSNYKAIANSLVTLYDKGAGKEIKTFYAVDGTYFFDLEPEKEYNLIARKKNFEDLLLSISTVGKRNNDTVTLDFGMKEIPHIESRVGERIGIVYWEFNKDYLTDGSPDTLARMVAFMNGNPQYNLEVGSHTDSKGSDEYNMKLSQRRSDAVLRFLASKKVPKERLTSKAYGETMPAQDNINPDGSDNPTGRDKNRRTEFKIISELTAEQQQQQQQQKTETEAPRKAAPKKQETKPAPKKQAQPK